MEDDGWDEDVDLQHSQLFVACQDDVKTRVRDAVDIGPAPASSDNKCISSKSSWSSFYARWSRPTIGKAWLNYVGLSMEAVADDPVRYIGQINITVPMSCVQQCIAEILESDMLTEDDASFLASVFGEKRDVDVFTYQINDEGILRRTLKHGWPTLMVALSYMACRCLTDYGTFKKLSPTVDRIVTVTLLASVFKEFTTHYLSWRAIKLLLDDLSSTKSFLRLGSTFLRRLKKSITFLHEIEVIGRGFLMTVSGTSLTSLEQSTLLKGLSTFPKSCRCDSLRITLLRSLRKVINLFRTATRTLLEKCPLRDDVDHKSHYIACMGVEEFGPLMTTLFENEAELVIVTDNLSISAIKSLSHLCFAQMSEFLRRFALCLSELKLERSSVQATFDATSEVLSDVRNALVRVTEDVRLSYDFHLNIATIKDQSEGTKSLIRVRPSKWDFTDRGAINTAMRSLSLHLQVAYCRVQELSTDLEHLSVEDDAIIALQGKMNSIDQDLRSCQACYDESLLRLNKIWRKSEDSLENPVVEPVVATKPECGVPVLSASIKTDMAPDDQVFEGYVDESEDSLNIDDDVDTCDVELRKRSDDEKEASRRMFAELKSVLVSKSEEWKKREARVLATAKPATTSYSSTAECGQLGTVGKQLPSNQEDDEEELRFSKAVDGQKIVVPVCCISKVSIGENGVEGMTQPSLGIAAMAAARSRMWNLNSTEDTFQSADVEEDSNTDDSDF